MDSQPIICPQCQQPASPYAVVCLRCGARFPVSAEFSDGQSESDGSAHPAAGEFPGFAKDLSPGYPSDRQADGVSTAVSSAPVTAESPAYQPGGMFPESNKLSDGWQGMQSGTTPPEPPPPDPGAQPVKSPPEHHDPPSPRLGPTDPDWAPPSGPLPPIPAWPLQASVAPQGSSQAQWQPSGAGPQVPPSLFPVPQQPADQPRSEQQTGQPPWPPSMPQQSWQQGPGAQPGPMGPMSPIGLTNPMGPQGPGGPAWQPGPQPGQQQPPWQQDAQTGPQQPPWLQDPRQGPPQPAWQQGPGQGPPWQPGQPGGPPQQQWQPGQPGGPPQQQWQPGQPGGPPQAPWMPGQPPGPGQPPWQPGPGQGPPPQWQPGQPPQRPQWQQALDQLPQMLRQRPPQQGPPQPWQPPDMNSMQNRPPHGWGPPPRVVQGNRTTIALCAIFLGSLGVHKFMLGMKTPGMILLGGTFLTFGFGVFVTAIVGVVEGVIYLSKSEADFYATYVVGNKEWF